MARDYELSNDYDFWTLAERYLEAGRDGVTLTVTKDKDEEEWVARIQYSDPDKRKYLDHDRAKGYSEEEAKQKLHRKLTDHFCRETFKELLSVIPRAERELLTKYAVLLLEAEHTVVLGSKDDDPEKIADRIGQREYWARVRAAADDIKSQVKDGDLKSQDDVEEAIGSNEIYYTGNALKVLLHSRSDEEYWEQTGEEPPGWERIATYAFQADVREALGFDPSDMHEVECARCGDVVATEDDPTDCPKCGLDLTTIENAGYHVVSVDDPTQHDVCENCYDTDLHQNGAEIEPGQEFDCYVCDNHCITPPAGQLSAPQAQAQEESSTTIPFQSELPVRGGIELEEVGMTLTICEECRIDEDPADANPLKVDEEYQYDRCKKHFVAPHETHD